jgi:viroplasmin and RNaseH domain-containing protein
VEPRVENVPRAKKYYVVRRGYQGGIFDNWPDCERQVTGFSRAEFKSFKSWEEAERYMSYGLAK